MDFANSPTTSALVLEKSSDWIKLFEQLKYEANLLGIWEYLDPDNNSTLTPLTYKDSLEKNISPRKQLQDLRELSRFNSFQKEEISSHKLRN
ncbi:hypothetical protein OnM2_022002 [Erysiphe neolycopersici]|uniref:Uncharacterized protein n=1 Tax=Erysiphe neolycopersici TaxID=212602 RepID=A0A420I2B5_9PEZI|nr:hypothetical protein OnM2_022002 [Erysiphe neolycopersici]